MSFWGRVCALYSFFFFFFFFFFLLLLLLKIDNFQLQELVVSGMCIHCTYALSFCHDYLLGETGSYTFQSNTIPSEYIIKVVIIMVKCLGNI